MVPGEGTDSHLIVEGIAAMALLISVVLGADQIRHLIAASRADEAAVAVARGALDELVQLRFAQWQLTPAEADVALFALKGCDVAEIAALRGAAAGTVRAQLARIYAKAGVTSHTALLALFVDELIDTSLLQAAGPEGENEA
ncbi:DNA-binding transcriptional regulator, CsgD family [Novosphingobium mathurense]|uniref:DNA-binding transcriptional regulator, CsgD family n=2 Tax=Novosphingobium mathurense TaxID=428990 RepID=A0A1U6IVZ3_9SPHN|nr:DNA-binding transcriptional regulator, CsgD family [Novosphingobium mathurense]